MVVTGKDGWLFLARDFGLASYRALEPLSPVALDRWEALFTDAERWLAARDITFLVVIAPNKSSIYEDKLPAGVSRGGPHSERLPGSACRTGERGGDQRGPGR